MSRPPDVVAARSSRPRNAALQRAQSFESRHDAPSTWPCPTASRGERPASPGSLWKPCEIVLNPPCGPAEARSGPARPIGLPHIHVRSMSAVFAAHHNLRQHAQRRGTNTKSLDDEYERTNWRTSWLPTDHLDVADGMRFVTDTNVESPMTGRFVPPPAGGAMPTSPRSGSGARSSRRVRRALRRHRSGAAQPGVRRSPALHRSGVGDTQKNDDTWSIPDPRRPARRTDPRGGRSAGPTAETVVVIDHFVGA